MNDDVHQHLLLYRTTQDYLRLSPDYCAAIGGLRWSDQEDAIVNADGRYLAFHQAIADFLEGFATGGRVIAFEHILHWIDLLQNLRGLPNAEARRVRELFFVTGTAWRSAGALAATLAESVPEVAQPPALELVCARLRDRVFPIRWYTASFHNAPEKPALSAADFQELVLSRLAALSDGDLQTWFATARGPVHDAGRKLVPTLAPPRTFAALLDMLLQRSRLVGAEGYMPQLVGALALPPRRLRPQMLPVGGYSDIVTHGSVEHLLPSQHALDRLEFVRRFAERELLYFRREEPPANERHELTVLLDQGVRTWGDVRLVLAAATLALARRSDARRIPFTFATTGTGGQPVAIRLDDAEKLGALLEASDLSSDPGLALERLLQEKAAGLRDVILLTHPFNLREPDVLAAARRLGPRDRLFGLTLDAQGEAELCEVRRGAALRVRQFHVDFISSQPKPPAMRPTVGAARPDWLGHIEKIPFPFRFGTAGHIAFFDMDADGQHLLTVSGRDLLHLWPLDGSPAECLPRVHRSGLHFQSILGVTGVVGGFAILGRSAQHLLVAHYDVTRRTCTVHVFPMFELKPGLRLEYVREAHSVVIASSDLAVVYACDLATGELILDSGSDEHARASIPSVLGRVGRMAERGRTVACVANFGELRAHAWVVVAWLDAATGAIRVVSQRPEIDHLLIPVANGRPQLMGGRLHSAQLAGSTFVAHVSTPADQRILLFPGLQAAGVREYPVRFRQKPDGSYLLSPDGRWLALRTGDNRLRVEPVDPGPAITTRAGGFTDQVGVLAGKDYALICQGGSGNSWHLFDWRAGSLVHAYERAKADFSRPDTFTHAAIRACLRRERPLTAVAPISSKIRLDPDRYRASLRATTTGGLSFLLDRYGQVAALDRQERLVAMFFTFRDRAAAWLPDGTRFGSQGFHPSPTTPGAAERIGQALRAVAENEGGR